MKIWLVNFLRTWPKQIYQTSKSYPAGLDLLQGDVEQKKLAELQKELNDWRESVGAEEMEPNPDFQN